MLLPLWAAAFACEPSLMSRFASPAAPPAELTVQSATAKYAGNTYVGAQVTMASRSAPAAWTRVLEHPELQDDWHPMELGTERVERIEGTDFYHRTGISVLGFTIRRQVIARVHWITTTSERMQSCWSAGEPAAFAARVAAWEQGSTWQEHGYGGWIITAEPGGGSLVDYQVWVESRGIPTPLISWGINRTLPTLLGAFEVHVAELQAGAVVSPAGAPRPR